ncbi:hypothetical protein Hdeb2414_s0034g00725061 [Helianthus debilis subsp. tardiflorus]
MRVLCNIGLMKVMQFKIFCNEDELIINNFSMHLIMYSCILELIGYKVLMN